jgi:uncharacterized protein (TIGR02757 family)
MNLKEKLEFHYKAFDKTHLSPDPLQFLHQYSDENDIEVTGLISALFAYGNVKQIVNTLNRITAILGKHPYNFLLNVKETEIKKLFKGVYHRFYSNYDVETLFIILRQILREEKSIKNIFIKGYNCNEKNLKNAISEFSQRMFLNSVLNKRKKTHGLTFMFPDPRNGSACKRMNLFLRWMIRKDNLDFGLWGEIPPRKLVIPVDTHVSKICRLLKLTARKNADWKMAEEITENLKKFDSVDPVKYDFAICHIGMRKLKF